MPEGKWGDRILLCLLIAVDWAIITVVTLWYVDFYG